MKHPAHPSRRAVTIPVFIAAILFGLLLLSFGCSEEASLDYDDSPDNVVIEYWVGGGLTPAWSDQVPAFRLYGDGRVIRKAPDTDNLVMEEDTLSEEEVRELLASIEDTGFFGLDDIYEDTTILDGTTEEITVRLEDREKVVRAYMTDVKAFDETVDLLLDYPLQGADEYTPEVGYLVVREFAEGGEDVLEQSNQIYSLLPDLSTLQEAAQSGEPIELDGETFMEYKVLEGRFGPGGLKVEVDGNYFRLFPLYEPMDLSLPGG